MIDVRKPIGAAALVISAGVATVTGWVAIEDTKEKKAESVRAEISQPSYRFIVRGPAREYLGKGEVSTRILLNKISKSVEAQGDSLEPEESAP